MAVRLPSLHHPVRRLRQAVETEFDTVADALQASPPDVHAARRALKRARALVRLAEAAWDDPRTPRTLRRSLRDAGRLLGRTRDAEALREAVVALAERPEVSCADSLELVGARLAAALNGVEARSAEVAAATRGALDGARRLLGRRRPRGRGRGTRVFRPGLAGIAVRGRRALRVALERPEDAAAHHELRKRAKELRYAVEFLVPAWPAVMEGWAAELHRLTDALGEANDLTLLLGRLDADPRLTAGVDGAAVAEAAAEVRTARWAAARTLARRVWAPRPRAFARDVDTWARIGQDRAQAPDRGSSTTEIQRVSSR